MAWMIYGLAVLLAIQFIFGMRRSTLTGEGAAKGAVNMAFMFLISLMLILILDINRLHIVWMYLVSFVVGVLSQHVFPFSLITMFGKMLLSLACIGLDREMLMRRREQYKRVERMMITEDITADEAIKRLADLGEWH